MTGLDPARPRLSTSDGAPSSTRGAEHVILIEEWLQRTGDGVLWTLSSDSQLNVNLVNLEPGHEIAEHRNDDVDVAVIVLDGRGEIRTENRTLSLSTSIFVHLPRGSIRSIRALDAPLRYLSVHGRRSGLTIKAAATNG